MSESSKNWKKMKIKLLELKKELENIEAIGNDAAKTVELDQSSVGRLSRMGAMQSQAIAIDAKNRREINLQKINAALDRIEKGEYGLCQFCNNEINPKRLEFDPATPVCIKCAQ